MAAHPYAEPNGFPRPIGDRTIITYRSAITRPDMWPWQQLYVVGVIVDLSLIVATIVVLANIPDQSVSWWTIGVILTTGSACFIGPAIMCFRRAHWQIKDLPESVNDAILPPVVAEIAGRLRKDFPSRVVFVATRGPHQLLGTRERGSRWQFSRLVYFAASDNGRLVDVDRRVACLPVRHRLRFRRPPSYPVA